MCSSLCFLSGKYEPEAMNFLEKKVGDLPSLQDSAAVVELAVAAMQHVLSTDFKSSEIEVAVVAAGGKFHLLSEEEVRAWMCMGVLITHSFFFVHVVPRLTSA